MRHGDKDSGGSYGNTASRFRNSYRLHETYRSVPRINVDLPLDLHTRLKMLVARERSTVKDVVVKVLREATKSI